MYDDILTNPKELNIDDFHNLYCAICTSYDDCQGHKHLEECMNGGVTTRYKWNQKIITFSIRTIKLKGRN